MAFTGERLVTGVQGDIVELHLHRYAMAMEFIQNKVVLDIASGEGYGSNLMANIAQSVIGVDIDEKTIAFAQSKYLRKNLSFKVGSADNIPVEDHSVDVVVSFETIEHHDKHEEMLQEIKRVLTPGGLLIMSSPDKLNYRDIPKHYNQFHIKELYREEFKQLIQRYFTHVKIFYQTMVYGSIIVPEDGKGQNFNEYSGDFDGLNSNSTVHFPVYNVCIASDSSLENSVPVSNSLFDCETLLHKILAKESEIYNSKTYRAGKLVTFPIHFLRKILKK